MNLPKKSIEQNNIIQQLSLNNNLVVDSVAGSGKTTCNLHIAQNFPNMNILLLTYNSKLKLETREKAQKIGINNIEVHSYHSFGVKYYDNLCFNDTIIDKILKNKNKPIKDFSFDIIVLDEAQDITSLYYELICKIYKDNINISAKICIFGDKKQSIFDFNKADQRFIEYAIELFNFNSYEWVKCNLSVSFRITYEMSLFINRCLLNEERIKSNKITNNKPRYIICNCFGGDISSRTFEEVKYYFDLGYKPQDIFILAPSIKTANNPIRLLENKIKKEMPNVMVYVPTNDDEKLNEELLEGKIIFSTFHQTKGLERKVVIIFNFDNSYFKFYKKDANPCICSNELYVATTRGIEQLTLFHHYNNEYLHFIDKSKLRAYCYFEDHEDFDEIIILNEPSKNIDTGVTEIIKFVPQNIIDDFYNQLEITQDIKYVKKNINIPLTTTNDKTTECVGEITGTAIPSMFELKVKNTMTIFEELKRNDFEKNIINQNSCCLIKLDSKPVEKKYNINDIELQNITPSELLYISNCYITCKSKYLNKIFQITNYNWLEKKILDECINRLIKLNISKNSLFELRLERENESELLNRRLIGYIDCVDEENNTVYEFKCVKQLNKEHFIQLALYMYMYELNKINHIKEEKEEIKKNISLNEKKLIEYKNVSNERNIINFINYLEQLSKRMKKIGENFKAAAYNRAINELNIYILLPTSIDITSSQELKSLKLSAIGKTILEKYDEFLSKYDSIKIEIDTIVNDLYKLNNQLNDINNLIDHKELYNIETKYVLYNILTNEYMNVKCEFKKLKKIIECLIYSKYISNKPITDDDFIKLNKKIYNLYFI
jgi:hypothetical protein